MSRQWVCDVIETRTYRVRYVVEAKTLEAARDKITVGDTVSEVEDKCEGVLDRNEFSPPVPLK